MCGGFHNEAEVGFKFSPKVLERFLRKLYDGDFDSSTEIEPTAWREVLRILNDAVAEGFAQSGHPHTLESDFYAELRQSNGVFAAFKVHSMAEKMAALLTDDEGKLKPFHQWKNEVQDISTHYVGTWLRTEYNTAVIRAHNAADWLQFERNRDILPNLRWMPTTSPNPEAEHKRFWEKKLTRPIDDPFWNKHRPGDRWNCKCSLEATDEPPTDIPDDADDEKPQRGLRGNPAKTGQIFDKSHPYFPKNCASCGFNPKKGTITSRMMGWFQGVTVPNCYTCRIASKCVNKTLEECQNFEVLKKERASIIANASKSNEKEPLKNAHTKHILRSEKVLKRLLYHCISVEELRAAVYVWNNPSVTKYIRESVLGEGKDMTLSKNIKNVNEKKKRGVVAYQVYEFNYHNEKWTLKMEEHKNGFEQAYHIQKNAP